MIHKTKRISFPRMHKESGERRVFLPEFIQSLSHLGFEVFIEDGYGSRSGFSFEDYQKGNPFIHRVEREEAYQQEYILVLRSPTPEEMALIPAGHTLISMLHYPTRPNRIARLKEHQLQAISLDSIIDDNGIRLVENMKAVAWNGLEAAFDVLEKRSAELMRDEPWKILVLGTGMVGKHAVEAGTKLGNVERYNDHIAAKGPGAIVWSVGRSITKNPERMKDLFAQVDVMVDATQRRNASLPLVPNEWVGWLPEHAVVVDLAVDPYTLDAKPPVVRGIEGIPQGDLNKYIFYPEDKEWSLTVPDSINSKERRVTVSCYSWPGIHPEACMRHYAQQLSPLMEVLAVKGYQNLSMAGNYFERALCRATLRQWLIDNN